MHWQTSMHSLAALSSSPLCSSLQPLPHSHSLKLPSDQSLVWASVVFDESFEAVAKSQLKLNKILFSLLSVVLFVYLHCFFNKRNSISFSKNLTLHCYKRIVCITHTHTHTRHTHTHTHTRTHTHTPWSWWAHKKWVQTHTGFCLMPLPPNLENKYNNTCTWLITPTMYKTHLHLKVNLDSVTLKSGFCATNHEDIQDSPVCTTGD